MSERPRILSDGRWAGPHGIGRWAANVLPRLPQHTQLRSGPRLLSAADPFWLSYQIGVHRPELFFSPGFSLPAVSFSPLVFTIYDLICVQFPAAGLAATQTRKFYFETIVRRAVRKAYRVLTVSEYSRRELLKWTGVHDEVIVNAGCGVEPVFTPAGARYEPGFAYILYVGNFKPHKNVNRLLAAFAQLDYPDLRLLLTGGATGQVRASVQALGLERRVQFIGCVHDDFLAQLYRGALLLVQPSLMEGFGLPPLEAMACGTPIAVSRDASLPEVAGDAGVFFDPLDVGDMRRAMERALSDTDLRRKVIGAGLMRAALFRWDDVSERVGRALGVRCSPAVGAVEAAV